MAQWGQVGDLPVDKTIEMVLRCGEHAGGLGVSRGHDHVACREATRAQASRVSDPRISMAGH